MEDTITLLRTKPARFVSLEDAAKKFKARYPELAGAVDDRLNILDGQLNKYYLPADENGEKENILERLVDAFMTNTPVIEFDYLAGVEFIKAEIYGREWEKEEERPNKFYLADEQVKHLAEIIRNVCHDGAKRRLFEITASYVWNSINTIAIDGFTVGKKEKINLVDWANSSIALMPIPSEEYMTPLIDGSREKLDAWKEKWDEKILGLVNEYGEIVKTPEAKKIARDAFSDISICLMFLRSYFFHFDAAKIEDMHSLYLDGTLFAAEIYGRLFDKNFALRKKITAKLGRRRIEDWPDTAPKLMAVRDAVRIFRNSDREKIIDEIICEVGRQGKPRPKRETVESWVKEYERREGVTVGENSKKLANVPVN